MRQLLVYTTAPVIADLTGTKTVKKNVGITATGKEVRLVSIPESEYTSQMNKYHNDLHTAFSEVDWKYELQFKNVFATEEEDGGE